MLFIIFLVRLKHVYRHTYAQGQTHAQVFSHTYSHILMHTLLPAKKLKEKILVNTSQAKSCELWTGKNKHYQLFSMGPRNLQPNASVQDLRIIVVHNVHGISRFKSRKVCSQ